MTTEDDFHRAIDAHPDDWQTRLVFADWLDEQSDPRAEGVRALVAISRRALPCALNFIFGSDRMRSESLKRQYELCLIPPDWLKLFSGALYAPQPGAKWRHYHTRREAEDAAAIAFCELPA